MEQLVHATLSYEGDAGSESDKLFETGHVDAVIVGITYLWRGTHDNHLLGMQTVENLDDALAECGSPHNAVVDDNKIIDTRGERLIGYIIHM